MVTDCNDFCLSKDLSMILLSYFVKSWYTTELVTEVYTYMLIFAHFFSQIYHETFSHFLL